MTDLLFYKQVAAINLDKHAELRIRPVEDYFFVSQVNSIPLVAAEVGEASREFPIVFAKGERDTFVPVALLGPGSNENLFVDEKGKWVARYIPAFIRRYPFVPAEGEDGQSLLCLDESAACLSNEDGSALFEDGQYGAALQHALAFVQEYRGEALRTQAIVQRLADIGLFEEAVHQLGMLERSIFKLDGTYVVNREKLKDLDGKAVQELFASGGLWLIHAHLMSLGNMPLLLQRSIARNLDLVPDSLNS